MAEINELRLQVFLARSGVASRRACEKIILDGRVQVNGLTISTLGFKCSPTDIIELDGKPLKLEQRKWYIALNKPENYICASHDPQGRRLALELLPDYISERVYNVGRLDYRSSGLVLFTNDGEFAARVSHPSTEIEKEYIVEATGGIDDAVLQAFRDGVTVEGVFYKCKDIERLGRRIIRIVLIEGKNREIRRVFSYFHLHPAKLHRVRIGPILLDSLETGTSRNLTDSELSKLFTPFS